MIDLKYSTVQVAQEISALLEGDEFEVGAELAHGAAGTESFEVKHWSGTVYRVCVVPIPVHRSTEFKPEAEKAQPIDPRTLSVGMKVRSGAPGFTFNRVGEVTEPKGDPRPGERVWIRWEGSPLSNRHSFDSTVGQRLFPV